MTKASKDLWLVYLLECTNGKIYCGITNNMEKRFRAHVLGKGAMFTRLNRPSHILATKMCKNRSDASKQEWAIKRLTHTKKRLLVEQWSR